MTGMLLDGLSWILLLGGAFFVLTGGVGLLRLPDVYSRMHAAGIVDTAGAGLYVAGLAIQGGFTLVTVKLLLIMAFILFTSPTSTYALAHAAFTGGVKPVGKDGSRAALLDRRGGPSNR